MQEEKLKSEVYYLDDEDNVVEKEKATKAVIRELDDKGNLVNEIWGTIDPALDDSSEDEDEILIEDVK